MRVSSVTGEAFFKNNFETGKAFLQDRGALHLGQVGLSSMTGVDKLGNPSRKEKLSFPDFLPDRCAS
jgi:hypothetical protein